MKKLIEKLEEQGRGMGLGPGGKCKCPSCGHAEEHGTGEACMEKSCPMCGAKMVREDIEEAAATPFDKAVKKIAKQTDWNDHGGAILTAAVLLKEKKLADRVRLVMKIHEIEGHMPFPLIQYRDGLYKEMVAVAKQKLSPDEYDRLLSSF